ncbi:MAG: ABC transporter permease [Gemmatimonadota bacterium]|nr:MAG: ABC transporter permease [Gemmatimonadota bacterium]
MIPEGEWRSRVPPLAELLFKVVTPARERCFVLGDLSEEFVRMMMAGTSRRAAKWWYWQQLFGSVGPGVRRIVRRQRPGRQSRKYRPFGNCGLNLRLAWRGLTRRPLFTVVAATTLALGIGANTTVFSIVNSMLLHPLPYPEPEQLVTLNHIYPSQDLVVGVSPPGFRDYRDRTQSFESVAITRDGSATLTGAGEPVRVVGSRVSADYFRVYGVAPALGRSFLPEEDSPGNQHVLVISDGFWKLRLGGDPNVLDRSIVLNDESYHVVGVMPSGFEDFFNRDAEFWMPIALSPEQFGDDYRFTENQESVARLKPGITVAMATREVGNLAETILSELSRPSSDWSVRVTSLQEKKTAGYRPTLLVLFGAVGFVLLITCANVANLLLARAIGRQKEIAIRKALGASRGHVIGQLLAESLVLSCFGGAAALLIAYWSTGALVRFGPDVLASAEIVLDLRVLLFTLGVALVAGVLFGLAPAVQGARGDLQSTLREGGQASRADRSGNRLRHLLIVGEFAVALVLLACSGLMIRTISQLRQVDPGFNPDHVLTANILLPHARYPDATTRNAFYDQLMSELSATPGITDAATTSVLPFSGNWGTASFSVEGYVPRGDDPPIWGDIRFASAGFARAMQIPVLEGRFFDATDGPRSPPVAVVDNELARRFWPDENPIGKRVTFGDPTDPNATWFTVIGVVGHTLHAGLDDDVRIQLYFSSRQFWNHHATLVLRTDADPEAMAQTVRRAVFSVDPAQPIFDVRTMENLIEESMGNRQFLKTLLTLFSGLAILLASLGVYGVMSHTVRERSRELGLRTALGATRPALFTLVMKSGLGLAGVGSLLGVGAALMLTRLMESQLFGVDAIDPGTLFVAAGILLGVAGLAICIPANRAARMDPLENLRIE